MSDRSFPESRSLDSNDMEFVEAFSPTSRIRAAFQLRFLRAHGRFPSRERDPVSEGLEYLAQQLDVRAPVGQEPFGHRHVNARRHRVAILKHPGARRATDRDRLALRPWIAGDCRRSAPTVEEQAASAYAWRLGDPVHVPSDRIMERAVRSARHDFPEDSLASTARVLPAGTRRQLDGSLSEPREPGGFHLMGNGAGSAALTNIPGACERLAFPAGPDLPSGHLAGIDPSWISMLCRRAERESASEMRRHGDGRRIGLHALYPMDRRKKLTDDLIDLFPEITHRLQTRPRRRVTANIARDIERVHGKDQLLCAIGLNRLLDAVFVPQFLPSGDMFVGVWI